MGLLDAFSPLGWRIPVWLGPKLAFVTLQDDCIEEDHQLFFDVGDAAADTAHRDKVGLGVSRLLASESDRRF